MDNFEDPPSAELACDKLLSPLKTTFGKLVALSSLRDAGSGEYRSTQFGQGHTPAVVSRVLRRRHESVFRGWLALGMEERHKDLLEFFHSGADNGTAALEDASVLIPEGAVAPERTLFLDELAFVLALIDGESSG